MKNGTNELRFDGRSVIITGAGRGIGRCHALLLAARGARVVVADLGGLVDGTGASNAPADQVVKEIEAAGGEAVACYGSVADPVAAAHMVQTALDHFGRVDAIINNAGISQPDLFEDLSLERFQTMQAVHYMGTIHVLKAAWPHLRAARYGRIVNTCSEAVLGIHQNVTSYGGAKGGVLGLTRTLASEGLKYGILVNAVAPRATTRMSDSATLSKVFGVPADRMQAMTPNLPPELVSAVVAFLAHESCQLTGEMLAAGGGQVQRLLFMETHGIYNAELTPEYIAANLNTLLDPLGAQPVQILQAEAIVQGHR